ncbi:MAG: ComF family protein [Planctomycetes bacterium]|nr:ComF family protein [Planctomycetota bacterium]
MTEAPVRRPAWPERYSAWLLPPRAPEGPWARRTLEQARRGLDAAAALLYPPHCMSCGTPLPAGPNRALCLGCAERIEWIGVDRCMRCGDRVGQGRGAVDGCPSCATHPPVYVTATCTLACYEEPLRSAILALKFSAGLQAVGLYGRLLAERVRETGLDAGKRPLAGIVPVPLVEADRRRRGFNQSEELALELGAALCVPVRTELLKKVRSTPPQATLNADARRQNLRGAFVADTAVCAKLSGAAVLVLDDVITTGSTVSECARTLRDAGVGEVRAVALARG